MLVRKTSSAFDCLMKKKKNFMPTHVRDIESSIVGIYMNMLHYTGTALNLFMNVTIQLLPTIQPDEV